ncbi:hypothetical protein AB1Y20_023374 [Prymnesium parvum]|uniref:NADH dehydrogenase [ubiquinone] 1 alpha subcomplex subunit 12 n=1 Tax=Prymnesium parvum TaxID=97485 RepID=A0AB34JD22_PRYPA
MPFLQSSLLIVPRATGTGTFAMGVFDKLARLANSLVEKIPKPPTIYDPNMYPVSVCLQKFVGIYQKKGLGYAYNKVRMESTLRVGEFVGTDDNGNHYYEDLNAPYTRTRWVEYPVPSGTWAIEDRYDGTMVSPEWYGWLHYMHDKPGHQVRQEYVKGFQQPHTICQTMQRPEYLDPNTLEPREFNIHQPPGQWGNRKPRGRIGNKYESWYKPESAPKLRNYADNAKTLHIE